MQRVVEARVKDPDMDFEEEEDPDKDPPTPFWCTAAAFMYLVPWIDIVGMGREVYHKFPILCYFYFGACLALLTLSCFSLFCFSTVLWHLLQQPVCTVDYLLPYVSGDRQEQKARTLCAVQLYAGHTLPKPKGFYPRERDVGVLGYYVGHCCDAFHHSAHLSPS